MAKPTGGYDTFLLRAGPFAAFILLAALVLLFRRGFDFSDEGSYLLAMARPQEYPTFHLLANFLYHPLYWCLGQDVTLLRTLWLAISFSAALALTRSFLKSAWSLQGSPPPSRALRYLSVSFASWSAAFLTIWLPTPNYNSLNFAAICLFAAGLLELVAWPEPSRTKPSADTAGAYPFRQEGNGSITAASQPGLRPLLLLALGVWLSFLGRPFTAPALILVAALAVTRAGRARQLVLPATLSFFLLIATALYADGSLLTFIDRFLEASRDATILGSHHPMKLVTAAPEFTWAFLKGPFTPLFLSLWLCGFAMAPVRGEDSTRSLLSMLLPPTALIALIFTPFLLTLLGWPKAISGHHLWAPPCGAFVRELLTHRKEWHPVGRTGLAAAVLLVLPPAYSLGSNNPLIIATSTAAFFPALGFTLLAARLAPIALLPKLLARLAWAGIFVAGGIVYCSAGQTYRQDMPLWLQISPVRIPTEGGVLLLSPEAAGFVAALQTGAEAAGFREGTPILDLSGRIPGAAYALGGFTPGTLWNPAGYPGTQSMFARALDRMSCGEIASAWLIADMAPLLHPLDHRLLMAQGARVPDDYLIVARAWFPTSQGPNILLMREHRLLKPERPFEVAEETCHSARAARAAGTFSDWTPGASEAYGITSAPEEETSPE
ncbi:MAG: hypothetical protein LBR80_14885 [Deltaproteobacteria bacterium]|jgi:hypothetical protein|nr:hypothetical protein [Deltaproteobacteria bacterium]